MKSVLVDGSLLLTTDPTGIGSYTRALAVALAQAGAQVDLLLGSKAQPAPGAPTIAMANQVFGAQRARLGRMGQLQRLWKIRGGFRRRLTAIPVPLDGIDLESMSRRLPQFRNVYNADDFLSHAQAIFAVSRRFTRIIPTRTPDVVHWTVPAPVFMHGVPNIYTVHDIIPLKFPHFTIDRGGRAAWLHAMIAQRADHLVTVSQRSAEDIKALLGVTEDRITVAYPAAPSFPAMDRSDTERLVSTVYGVQPGRYVFFCGAIEPKKNLYRLIEAFSMAGTRQQLLIAGPLGWMYDEVQDLLNRVAAAGVRYLGYLPRQHIGALIQCASFFAFPSLYEGFGIPVLEAMQLGTPVLTSHAGSLPEVVGDAALMIDPLNVTAISGAIRQLTGDADLRDELSRRGREQAKQFSVGRFADGLTTAYRAVGVNLAARAPQAATQQNPLSAAGAERAY